MTSVVLIQDVVDLIVDSLVGSIEEWLKDPDSPHRRDYPVSIRLRELKQCALVNKAFAARAQKYIFSRIRIWTTLNRLPECIPDTEKTSPTAAPALDQLSLQAISNLLDILKRKPHLAGHVQTIDASAQLGHVLEHCQHLVKLLDLLRTYDNPRWIELRNAGRIWDSRGIPADFRFQERVAANLQVLECEHLAAMPLNLLANSPHLSSLTLRYCSAEAQDQKPQDRARIGTSPLPKLKHLSLFDSWTVLDALVHGKKGVPNSQAPVDFSSLEHLTLDTSCYKTGAFPSVQRLLSMTRHSLKSIMLSKNILADYERSYSTPLLDLSICGEGLEDFRLSVTLNNPREGHRLRQIVDTLNTIPSPNAVKHIELFVDLSISRDFRNRDYGNPELGWEELDRVLNRIASTCSISSQKVHFVLHLEFKCQCPVADKECARFVKQLEERVFPEVQRNGRIVFVVDYSMEEEMLFT
ncbi:hypothetical protein CVT24_011729 [Panaeolus cyanescens]|uniref:F-box domain-containing protein n=1 Tax=Panaeolus cyanescens TaxID=181874 RepID=A0A409YH95_9AGAR|nr:hypothetical protein CVT24_011729 [Panaeolus cyanescens]